MNTISGRAAYQARQHQDNTHPYLFPLLRPGKPLPGHKHIRTRRTFQCRAAGNVKEQASIRGGVFTVSLRNIQGNIRRSPIQLVVGRQTLWPCFQEFTRPHRKTDRILIDGQLLMVKQPVHGDSVIARAHLNQNYDYEQDYDYESTAPTELPCAQMRVCPIMTLG
jgi:hypothetical protein